MAINWKQKLLLIAEFNTTWIGLAFKLFHVILVAFNKYCDIKLLIASRIWLTALRNLVDNGNHQLVSNPNWRCYYDQLDCCNQSHDELIPLFYGYQANFIRLCIFFTIGSLADVVFILHQWILWKTPLAEYKNGEMAIVSFISRLQLLLMQVVPIICITLMLYNQQFTNTQLNCAYCWYNYHHSHQHKTNISNCSIISNGVQNDWILALKIMSTLLITLCAFCYIATILHRCSRNHHIIHYQVHHLTWCKSTFIFLLACITTIAVVSIFYVPISLTYLSMRFHILLTNPFLTLISDIFIDWIRAAGYIAMAASSTFFITVFLLFITCRFDSITVINALIIFLTIALMPLIAYIALIVHYKILFQNSCRQKINPYRQSRSSTVS
ncbi:hypothetical protein TrispH2_002110 [Trichoplax sp. H2]|nr:hypothetical protein TrispH2_002110 [Trichoplax sp. H2]|eukprot:RDD45828.1 hypothetical protein TrispH2_002110 [Trichoplax sp. H2]